MQTDHITFERFAQVGLAARRHFGGRLDQALRRAAENELVGLLGGSAEDPDGRLAFYHELETMAVIAAECVRLWDDGQQGEPGSAIFGQARATVSARELPF